MKILISIAAAFALTGCAIFSGGPVAQYDAVQTIYNAAMARLIAGRTPCIATPDHPEFGPGHPQCLVSDATYAKIEPVRATASRCLDDASRLIAAGAEKQANVYLACAEGSAAALVEYLVKE